MKCVPCWKHGECVESFLNGVGKSMVSEPLL